jgi:hypothetical protein
MNPRVATCDPFLFSSLGEKNSYVFFLEGRGMVRQGGKKGWRLARFDRQRSLVLFPSMISAGFQLHRCWDVLFLAAGCLTIEAGVFRHDWPAFLFSLFLSPWRST